MKHSQSIHGRTGVHRIKSGSSRKFPTQRTRKSSKVKRGGVASDWLARASAAGRRHAEDQANQEAAVDLPLVNRLWSGWALSAKRKIPAKVSIKAGKRYLHSFCRKMGIPIPPWVLVPVRKSIAAIVVAKDEEQTLPTVLQQLARLPLSELIVVINGSADRSFARARAFPSPIIVHYPDALGHDVGRAVGAKLAQSDIMLFVDGDIPISAGKLAPFILSVDWGKDVALNNISPYTSLFRARDSVTRIKEFLNRSLGRSDLRANSLTAVPHALSRKAVEVIDPVNLIVPPMAQSMAILRGLAIAAPASVDVIGRNRLRKGNIGEKNRVESMIIGDHIEALDAAMREKGARLAMRDRIRKRAAAAIGGEFKQ